MDAFPFCHRFSMSFGTFFLFLDCFGGHFCAEGQFWFFLPKRGRIGRIRYCAPFAILGFILAFYRQTACVRTSHLGTCSGPFSVLFDVFSSKIQMVPKNVVRVCGDCLLVRPIPLSEDHVLDIKSPWQAFLFRLNLRFVSSIGTKCRLVLYTCCLYVPDFS